MYPELVNERGFVAINKTIYKYDDDRVKMIKSLDFNKIKELEGIDEFVGLKIINLYDRRYPENHSVPEIYPST